MNRAVQAAREGADVLDSWRGGDAPGSATALSDLAGPLPVSNLLPPHRPVPLALVIDDDPFMRLLARGALEQAGLQVAEASAGRAGLAAIGTLQPDIVLLDVVMPDMDGFAVCRQLRQQAGGKLLPTLMLTGLDDTDSIRQAFDAGATDFISKPIVGPILGHRVQYMLSAARTMQALAQSEAKLANAQRISAVGSWDWHLDEDQASWSAETYCIFGVRPEAYAASHQGFLQLVHPDDKARVETAVRAALELGKSYDVEHRIRRPDGVIRIVHGQGEVLSDQTGRPVMMQGTLQDITERREAEARIRASEDQLASVLDSIDNAVWSICAASHEVLYLNPAAERILGRSLADFQQTPGLWLDIAHANDRERLRGSYASLPERGVLTLEYRIVRPDGEVRWLECRARLTCDDAGRPRNFDGVAVDITERKRQETRINRMANYDALTELPNRNLLSDRVAQAIALAHRTGQQLAMLCLDLDGFKFINDSFGHAVGDELLKRVAERLVELVRECDTVARLGGDEFVVILTGLPHAEAAATIAQKILRALARPFALEQAELRVSASIGVSVFPDDGDIGELLLQHADAAMYSAKAKGRDCCQFYTHDLSAKAEARVALESALRHALEQQEFEVHYQPTIDLRSGQICGAEALLRWQRPGVGLVLPGGFITLAEELGLIVPMGEWILRSACAQLKAWHQQGYPKLTMAVNLSGRQFWYQNMPELVSDVLTETDLAADKLELELTESTLMRDGEAMVEVLRQLKKLGISLALDDFGTGYSSLFYLKQFPIDILKIDRAFVRDVTSDADNAALTKAILLMAQSLKMRTVAEGVETEGQLGFLNQHKCDAIQGAYFSMPVPAAEFTAMLQQNKHFAATDKADRTRNTILILDDEPNIVNALSRVFRQEDYQILRAFTPSEAFELLAVHPVQVILSDQRMSSMPGTEFLGRVKEMYPKTIRIILSGYTELTSVIDAINCGAVYRYFTKPWEDQALRENIREAFQLHWQLYGVPHEQHIEHSRLA